MERRLANAWHMTVNEKRFIEAALQKELRADGRRPFDHRQLVIKFGKEDGCAEVHLGQTHVMGHVTAQLVQPYRDRPNEGTLSIFVELSPMADPSFEVGRPGESAIELGRVIDRGLRESKAIDTESLVVIAGKHVWALRVDLHIIDNGGNLVDAANIAALAALKSFRRPDCSVAGEDGQEVIIHPPEAKEPLPLVIHHLPIAVTFAFFDEGNAMIIDPSYSEEAVMGGRMIVTMNVSREVCAVQKAGQVGVTSSIIRQCLDLAGNKAAVITKKIENAVELNDNERTLRKVKRHPSVSALEAHIKDVSMIDSSFDKASEPLIKLREKAKNTIDRSEGGGTGVGPISFNVGNIDGSCRDVKPFTGRASSWDPYPKEISSGLLTTIHRSPDSEIMQNEQAVDTVEMLDKKPDESHVEGSTVNLECSTHMAIDRSDIIQQVSSPKSLKDAVKPKNRRKKKAQTSN